MLTFAQATGLAAAQNAIFVICAIGLGSVLYAAVRWYRKNRFVEYGVRLRQFELATDGLIEYAEWEHRKTTRRDFRITQSDVDDYRRFVSEGDFVIDIGAYCGDKTLPMALAAGASGCVLALEPNPHVFKALQRNTALNRDKTNIVAMNFAATRVDGTFTFHYSDASFCNGGYLSQLDSRKHGHRHELEVEGRNLERLLRTEFGHRLHRLSLIKIDAEGYDRHVIRSIISVLQQFRPVLICEVYKHLTRAERDELFDVLQEAGYTPTGYDGTEADCLGRKDLYQDKNIDILALPAPTGCQRAIA